MIELASANPNNEWSVKTALIPILRACSMDSWAKDENAYNQTQTNRCLNLREAIQSQVQLECVRMQIKIT